MKANTIALLAALLILPAPAAQAADVKAGDVFYHLKRTRSDGTERSCATCHTDDPRNRGMTRANKEIEPLAPSANPLRFTDPAKVEKWFERNCNDVLERPCTPTEKENFIQYLRSVQ